MSDLSLNDNPTRAIRTLHRSDPRRPGVLLRRYDTTLPYLSHVFRSRAFRKEIPKAAAGVTRFNVSRTRFGKLMIPIPPLDRQRAIGRTLDSFDTLVNGLTSGLPAELNARRQQYEYYRDKLLTFKELKS
ncbi:restriction endonuclease subunit S [Propionibacterium freudenreichii]|nr:restriction endonuclease subunit S [Propionibacterium freudenreichii]